MAKPNKEYKPFFEDVMEGIRKARPYVAIALAIGLMTVSAIPDMRWKIGVLISLGSVLLYLSFDIYKVFTVKMKELHDALKDINENVEHVQDPLYKVAYLGKLGRPEVQVARKMFKATTEAAQQLQHPKKTFSNHEEYTYELMRRINRMIANKCGRICAACGEKDWEHEGTQKWFNRNYEALKSNVSIKRIFIEELGWDADAAEKQMQEQANKGINVRLAKIMGLSHHPLLHSLPKGFGFVIFDYESENEKPQVIVHNDPTTEKSLLFDDPMIVNQFISTFNELYNSYSKEKFSNNQTEAGIMLEKEILQKSNEISRLTKHLLDHRFSNLQLNFINWRFESELAKLNSVLFGELPIHALDKFSYLGEIFGQLQQQLKKGDRYQTISTVDIWSGKNIGTMRFLRANSSAVKTGAIIDRIVFIDIKRLNSSPGPYHAAIKNAIELFERFNELDHPPHSLKFFIDDVGGEYQEILQHAPVVLITEDGNKNRLGIYTHHVSNNEIDTVPYLDLKFYVENKSDKRCKDFVESFEPMKSKSISIDAMKEKLMEIVPGIFEKHHVIE